MHLGSTGNLTFAPYPRADQDPLWAINLSKSDGGWRKPCRPYLASSSSRLFSPAPCRVTSRSFRGRHGGQRVNRASASVAWLDKSWLEQFTIYVRNLVNGDWGTSLSTGRPVTEELLTRLPASLELTLIGLGLAILVAIPLGVLAATRPDSWIDHLCRVMVTAGVSLPTFFTGLFLVYIFYYLLGWSPSPLGRLSIVYLSPPHVTGFYTIDSLLAGDRETFVASIAQLILPAATLGLFALAPIARMTRASMLGALASDFIRTARANGLSNRVVLVTYAFRNAALPVLTTLGMVFSFLLGANVLVEKVFSWPGIGSPSDPGPGGLRLRRSSRLCSRDGLALCLRQPVHRCAPDDGRPARRPG